jgi:hypothetical protein
VGRSRYTCYDPNDERAGKCGGIVDTHRPETRYVHIERSSIFAARVAKLTCRAVKADGVYLASDSSLAR